MVDGAWFADPENPDTQPDPYGGANSLVNVGADGKLVAARRGRGRRPPRLQHAAERQGLCRRPLPDPLRVREERLRRRGRTVDPRYRLQRPTPVVDLNFDTEVSDLADTFTRLRLDSDENIIQNNIAAFLDEAALTVHPANFTLTAYWNQEIFTGGDLMRLGGDIDLPGTILHDHLDFGKGTAGGLFTADPVGVHLDAFFANVHNQDFYNDPDLFDNTGEDRVGAAPVAASRQPGNRSAAVGRALADLDGLRHPGRPALDGHPGPGRAPRRAPATPAPGTRSRTTCYNCGLDLRYRAGEQWLLGAEGLAVDRKQQFVTGNQAGQNNTNGAMDVPFLDRDAGPLPGRGGLDAARTASTVQPAAPVGRHRAAATRTERELAISYPGPGRRPTSRSSSRWPRARP